MTIKRPNQEELEDIVASLGMSMSSERVGEFLEAMEPNFGNAGSGSLGVPIHAIEWAKTPTAKDERDSSCVSILGDTEAANKLDAHVDACTPSVAECHEALVAEVIPKAKKTGQLLKLKNAKKEKIHVAGYGKADHMEDHNPMGFFFVFCFF